MSVILKSLVVGEVRSVRAVWRAVIPAPRMSMCFCFWRVDIMLV